MVLLASDQDFSHLDAKQRPVMVNVGHKAVTAREAEAEALVVLPANVAAALRRSGHRTAKGPIFDTAIIAGVMAVKNTSGLIPFCHPLPIDHAQVQIEAIAGNRLRVRCRVSATHRTGVEMEALTGATVAALTIYDMCKALSHRIRIAHVKLVSKRGGKRDIGPRAKRVARTPGPLRRSRA
jgi:cyclic pyranopterin phosphate synthase